MKEGRKYSNYEEEMMDKVNIFEIAKETIENNIELSKKGTLPSTATYHKKHDEYSVFVKNKNRVYPDVRYVLIFDKNAEFKKEISHDHWLKEYHPDTPTHRYGLCSCFDKTSNEPTNSN